MSVTAMEKLTVIAGREEVDDLLSRLMRLRCVSLVNAPPGKGTQSLAPAANVPEAAAFAARIDAVLPVLAKHSRRKFAIFRPQAEVSFTEFRRDGRYDLAVKVVEETEKILAQQAEWKAVRDAEASHMQSYTPYLDWNKPLDLSGTAATAAFLGSLPSGTSPDAVLAALQDRAAVVQVLCSDATGLYIFAVAHRSEAEATRRALAGIGFLQANFPDAHGTAKALFDRADRARRDAAEHLEHLEIRLDSLAERIGEVEILSDVAHTAVLTEEHKARLSATKQCALLTLWCPVYQKDRVTRVLERADAAYEFAPPAEGEDVPVLLRNNGFARNFEWVLGMYSYPAYGKFDPTFVMSIFYFLIFGLMFADAGYGLVLSLVCFGAVRFLKPREGMKRFLLMFGYCGISCIICGVLFGSYFGNFPLAFMENVLGKTAAEMPHLSILPSEAANVAVLFDPLQNPMAFLVVSLGVGALHLIAGMAVKAYILCRRGKVLDALFDVGSYWLLFAGIGTVFFSRGVGIGLLVGGVLAILCTQGRDRKGFGGKLIGGLGGLYGLINYASDLLSYSRILALGLAAAVIGQVVNILATLKGASFIGFLLMIVIFIIGHLLNLVINVLGTFVHASRLQYIEFFGKFYEDGGTPFRPIAPADKYSADTTPADASAAPAEPTATSN